MTQETRKIAQAWWLGDTAHAARTTTDGEAVFLHGNKIAWRGRDPVSGQRGYCFTLAGWPTPTTRERLNGILNIMGASKAGFFQKDHKQFFTNLLGETVEISDDEIVFIGA